MKIHRTTRSTEVGQDDHGFTLIEILIAIVLIGILSAVAVVGISNLVSKGSSASCKATADSSTAASAVYFASVGNVHPTSFKDLTTLKLAATAPVTVADVPAALTLPSGVVVGASPFATLVSGTSWTLTGTFSATGAVAPIFAPCP